MEFSPPLQRATLIQRYKRFLADVITPDGRELTLHYIEVKSVTLAENEQGYFPDAVTERGQKHLRELMSVAAEGQRAVIFFAVLHSAITRFSPARHIDEKYAQLLSEAQQRGVEILAYKAEISAEGMALKKSLPVTL